MIPGLAGPRLPHILAMGASRRIHDADDSRKID